MARAAQASWLLRAAALPCLLALTPSCSFFRLSRELETVKQAAMLTGRVQPDASRPGEIYVADFASSPAGASHREAELLPPGETQYRFFVNPDEGHLLIAFQDTNGDRRWEPGEPAGALPRADGLVSPREVRALPILSLDPAFRPPQALSLDLRRDKLEPCPPLALGQLITLDDPAFDPEQTTEGMWAPIAAARASGLGIYFLQPYDPQKIPVLFVHGIKGSPRDFAPMISQLDTTRYQAWVMSYPSGLRLQIVAHLLHDELLELRERYHPRQVVVTAHSMGGLVARAALLELADEGHADFVHPFVSISTPYGGHAAAANGVRYAPEVVPSWIDLSPGSPFLGSLQEPLPRGLPFYLFFGMGDRASTEVDNRTGLRAMLAIPGQLARFVKQGVVQFFGMGARAPGFGNMDDGVVSIPSQLASFAKEDAVEIYGYDVGHTGILADPDLLRRYRRLIDADLARSETRSPDLSQR